MSNGGYAGAAGLGALLGQASTTTVANYPGQVVYGYPNPPAPSWPHDIHDIHQGIVGIFKVRKIENGYAVEYQLRLGDHVREYYAETLKDVGERIAALGVQKALEGETPQGVNRP